MKNRNFTNLNVNPCKMCMPMGAVTAFKGIENSMMILHGSQGCSTYIRRHMAGHYNEPVDVASTSLSEEGTVYGGEKNLRKGLLNIIKQYQPEVIGVATTCLAETIGEDIKRIIHDFEEQEGISGIEIIPVSTPGYGGTQFEGYFAALLSIVKKVCKGGSRNNRINIIAANLNPGDIRNIKSILHLFNIDYILLPDISETLDAPYSKVYRKIPEGGARLSDIKMMSGAAATIEMGMTIPENLSPGQYLHNEFQVPLYKCSIPIGVRSTDYFIDLLTKLTKTEIPEQLIRERGRMLDGMIDSHKYNAEGRAVIYGEPEQVYAVSRFCLENGIRPVLISTGSQTAILKTLLSEERNAEDITVIDDTDFNTILKYSVQFNANILIGSSDGKIITEKKDIPLVRYGFPIHDRIGGQRVVFTGYNGSLRLLDEITNTLLENKYRNYRKRMFENYYEGKEGDGMAHVSDLAEAARFELAQKTENHPCYSSNACKNARMHIPVAPACNISCNYCNRKFDCQNESRPGVTSEVLSPEQALQKFLYVKTQIDNLKVVGIAGPGDALANFENTKRSIDLIKEADRDMTFCLSTNGLLLPQYASELLDMGVSHITITINAIDPEIAARIYKEINYMGEKYVGIEAAQILIKNQLEGLQYLTERGAIVKVNIVMIKGVNDSHIKEVVKKVKALGAFMTNIMPLIPASGSVFEDMPMTSNIELNLLRKMCEIDLKQMYHCKQCRADAVGMLGNDIFTEFRAGSCKGCSPTEVKGQETMPRDFEEETYTIAIASKSGLMVDEHFGHANEFYIYKIKNRETAFVEKRMVLKYCTGEEECDSEESKINHIINTISDCDAILVMRIGYNPSKVLESKGISVIQTCGRIQEAVESALLKLKKECLEKVV